MKTLLKITLLFALIFSACNNKLSPKTANSNLDWLMGNWQRTNETEDKQTFETWQKINTKTYRGKGVTLQGSDTVWQENMLITKLKKNWQLAVTTPQNETPVVFNFTEISSNSFTCENPDNDFPKVIKYRREGNKIHAEISGGGPTIPFEFLKVD